MDDIMTTDPELAAEMVKLLGQELKVVRAQLRDAETVAAENDALKADNAVLQERIDALQDGPTLSPVKLEHDVSEVSMSHMTGEFARLLAENERLIREKEEVLQNQEKLMTLQEKYKRSKAKAHEYHETRRDSIAPVADELHAALENCTQELEQTKEAMISEIDFRDVLKDIPYEPVDGQSELSSIQSYNTRFPKQQGAKDICEGSYFISYNEVIWSTCGIALDVVVKPVFQYNPKIGGGTWVKLENHFDVGKQMDVCYLSGKSGRNFRYLGTYERMGNKGTLIVATESLKHLDREKFDYASKRTTLFPDLLPPSQTQMIKNMYKQGVIHLQCFAIRCIAYNRTFAKKLQDMCANSIQHNPSDNTNVRKRKRDSTSVAHTAKNKKRCGPTLAT